MVASSAAMAAPLLVNVPGVLLEARAESAPHGATGTAAAASSFTTYFITSDCTGCQTCRGLCPANAIHFGEGQNVIDQSKCIHCGTCYDNCQILAISATEPAGKEQPAKPIQKASRVMDCDLVVLGAGASGLIGAVKAADLSGKKVIVLEKAKKPGGNSYFATGFMTQDSQWQKDAGAQVRTPQDISGQFFDWLVSKGGAEEFFIKPKAGAGGGMIGQKGRLPKWEKNADPTIGPGKGGTFVVEKMLECCKEKNIPVLLETRAKKLITDASGKVTAVLADTPEGELRVNCKACLIATGGFGASVEKCKKLWPEEWNNKPMMRLGSPLNVGDGIDMAQEIGVMIDLSAAVYTGGGPVHHPYTYAVGRLASRTANISLPVCVNRNGERWLGEEKNMGYDPRPDSLANQPGAGVFYICDSAMLEKMGDYVDHGDNEVLAGNYPVGKWRTELAEEVALDESGARGDHTKKADTLIELAVKMNVDPKVFVATIEAFNSDCSSGKNAKAKAAAQAMLAGMPGQGGGPGGPPGGGPGGASAGPGGAPGGGQGPGGPGGPGAGGPMGGSRVQPPDFTSTPISKGPFYAFYCWRFTQTTKGGILVDYLTMEAYDKNDKKISGLFACGDTITARKPYRIERLSGISNATTTGYKAGLTAGNYLKNL